MKRDKALIHGILKLAVDDDDDSPLETNLNNLPNESRYQFKIMLEAGLIKKTSENDEPGCLGWSITWEGHRFYEAHTDSDGEYYEADFGPAVAVQNLF